MTAPARHVIGEQGPPAAPQHFGDVRDQLVQLPGFGEDGYAVLDLFTVRFPLIAELEPEVVCEIGAYRGYFLVTCLEASRRIERVGWIDCELDLPGSNAVVEKNIAWTCERLGRPPVECWYDTRVERLGVFGRADLVQVDAAHGYENCLTDLIWAASLEPRAIFVDDFTAHLPVRRATLEFAEWRGWRVEEHETVNGLAILRPKEG